ncbi:hypothetical protein EYF80_032161 [Liparis tanakae]|uniref:Uncharacterized protein n=1 Tax=Liparis tanakae TaxID=230148 RepID=A0A4Z2GWG8_9TELE|nr:hypothetical protein EYF80_032161 [Liparis tanakae]
MKILLTEQNGVPVRLTWASLLVAAPDLLPVSGAELPSEEGPITNPVPLLVLVQPVHRDHGCHLPPTAERRVNGTDLTPDGPLHSLVLWVVPLAQEAEHELQLDQSFHRPSTGKSRRDGHSKGFHVTLGSSPGQTAMLQNLVCFSGPSQASPPCCGGAQLLVRDL